MRNIVLSERSKKEVKILFYTMLTDFRNSIAIWKVGRYLPFVLPARATVDEDKYGTFVELLWEGKTRNPWRKTYPIVNLSAINPTWTDVMSKPGLRDNRPGTNLLKHGADSIKVKIVSNYTYRFSAHCTVNTKRLGYIHQELRVV